VDRERLPIEISFASRVARSGATFFSPIALSDSPDLAFHKEVSYLIDAFDQLPLRPDVAFDSTFKALESTVKRLAGTTNVTEALRTTANKFCPSSDRVSALLDSAPVQTCEYLYKRLAPHLQDWANGNYAGKVLTRLSSNAAPDVVPLLQALSARQVAGVGEREQAMFLRLALRGISLTGGHPVVQLGLPGRVHLLLAGLLYTARNDRFHGESFSPFVSSAASIKTYAHPHYLFLAAYGVLNGLWLEDPSRSSLLTADDVVLNITDNINSAQAVFGRHWNT
jgi:hypothetical protein